MVLFQYHISTSAFVLIFAQERQYLISQAASTFEWVHLVVQIVSVWVVIVAGLWRPRNLRWYLNLCPIAGNGRSLKPSYNKSQQATTNRERVNKQKQHNSQQNSQTHTQSLRRKRTHTILQQVTTLRESETTRTQITQLEKSIFSRNLPCQEISIHSQNWFLVSCYSVSFSKLFRKCFFSNRF